MSAPIAKERVLPTLNADGTRFRIRPRLYPGRFYAARRLLGWALIVLFVGLPFVRIHDKPAILLDVMQRQFVLFGRVFLATDGVLLMLLMLSIFVSIVWVTTLVGRAWCGWGCPQTVYMELLFRPIERLFEGNREAQLGIDKNGGGGRRLAKNAAFFVLSLLLANVFLSYFVGTDALRHWVLESPTEHWPGFLVVAVTTGLVFFDFAYFREQMCTVICPYARLQAVLLDKKSLIVGYDARRGEPRSHGKAREPGHGDCIDCRACVTTCPTGIDIREGLQLECIACTQCIDACDSIMDRIKKPRGLIRYSSQTALETGSRTRMLRPRVFAYSAALLGLVTTLVIVGGNEPSADITLLRGIGAPFTESGTDIVNQIRLKVRNRAESSSSFRLELEGLPEAKLIAPELPLRLDGGAQRATSVFVVLPRQQLVGKRRVTFRIIDDQGIVQELPYTLLGPEKGGAS